MERTRATGCFFCGAMASICWTSLLQDGMGREAYLKMEAERWMDPRVTIPLALIGLVFSVGVYLFSRHQEIH